MRRFRFRLEKLLDHKRRLEEAAAIALAQAMAAVAKANEVVLELEASLRAIHADRASAQVDNDWSVVFRAVEIETRLQVSLEAAREALVAARDRAETARIAAVEAMTERKVVEKLREDARAEYDAEAALEQLKEVDDIVTARHGKEATVG